MTWKAFCRLTGWVIFLLSGWKRGRLDLAWGLNFKVFLFSVSLQVCFKWRHVSQLRSKILSNGWEKIFSYGPAYVSYSILGIGFCIYIGLSEI